MWTLDGTDIFNEAGECIGTAYAMTQPDGSLARDARTYANARLMAEAPALLAAAEGVIDDLKHYVATHGPGPDARLLALMATITRAKAQG